MPVCETDVPSRRPGYQPQISLSLSCYERTLTTTPTETSWWCEKLFVLFYNIWFFLCLPFFITILLSLNMHFAFPKRFSSTLTYPSYVE